MYSTHTTPPVCRIHPAPYTLQIKNPAGKTCPAGFYYLKPLFSLWEFPADRGSFLLDERLVHRHYHARIDLLCSATWHVEELKLSDRQGTTTV